MADDISKTSKQTVEAIDRISDKLEDFYKKANKTNYFKSITKLADEIDGLSSNFSKLENNFSKLGISSEKSLGGILSKAEELQKKFKSFADSSRNFSNLQNKIGSVQKTFSLLNKTMNAQDLKDFKNTLSSLGKDIDLNSFNQLSKSVEEALSSGSAEKFKETLKSLAPAIGKGIGNKLKELKEDAGVFNNLSKESQDFINGFDAINLENLKDPAFFESIANGVGKIGVQIQSIEQEKFQEIAKGVKQAQETIEKLNKSLATQNEYKDYFDGIRAEFDDLSKHINRQKLDLGFKIDSGPTEDQARDLKEISLLEKQILYLENKKTKVSADQSYFLDSINKKIDEAREKHQGLVSKQKEQLNFQEKYNNALKQAPLNKYATAWMTVQDKSIDASVQIKNIADITSQRFPKLGGMIEKVADKFKLVGANAAKFKFGAGMILGAYTLLKAVTEIEKKSAAAFREINSSGLLVGKTTDEIGSSMTSLAHETNNVVGLFEAARGASGSFALSREEVLGTASALDKAGLASRNLNRQMSSVMGSISGTSSEIVGAATMVRTFSNNLGIADAEVANLMGNMAFEFNSTMGSLQENFTGITSAIQSSSMSSTRFLGILGTSTAGMSIYAEQVEDTARSIARLDKNTNLSQKGIERFTKGAAEAAQNSELMATNMAIYLRGQKKEKAVGILDKSKTALSGDIAKLEEKKKMQGSSFSKDDEKLLGELKGQRYATEEMSKFISKGDFFNAAQFADRIGSDANLQVQSMMLEELMKQSGGNEALAKQLAKSAGMEGMMGEVLKLAPDDREKLIKGLQEGDKGAIKRYEELQKEASETERYTGEGLGKLIESIGNTTNILLSGITGILTTISVMIGTMGGFSSLKNLKDIFFKKGGGGNYTGGGSRSIGIKTGEAVSNATKGGGGILSSVGKVAEKVMGSGVGKGMLKVGGALSKGLGKIMPGVGLALAAKDVYDVGSKFMSGEEVSGKQMAELGLSVASGVASIIPGIGTAVSAALAAGSAGLGLIPDEENTPSEAKKIEPSINNQNLGYQVSNQANKEMMKNASNYVDKIENHFVYNIKGEDEQRIRKIVNEGIQDAIKYIREGSGKSS